MTDRMSSTLRPRQTGRPVDRPDRRLTGRRFSPFFVVGLRRAGGKGGDGETEKKRTKGKRARTTKEKKTQGQKNRWMAKRKLGGRDFLTLAFPSFGQTDRQTDRQTPSKSSMSMPLNRKRRRTSESAKTRGVRRTEPSHSRCGSLPLKSCLQAACRE